MLRGRHNRARATADNIFCWSGAIHNKFQKVDVERLLVRRFKMSEDVCDGKNGEELAHHLALQLCYETDEEE